MFTTDLCAYVSIQCGRSPCACVQSYEYHPGSRSRANVVDPTMEKRAVLCHHQKSQYV